MEVHLAVRKYPDYARKVRNPGRDSGASQTNHD
jgi:hypothetical protein